MLAFQKFYREPSPKYDSETLWGLINEIDGYDVFRLIDAYDARYESDVLKCINVFHMKEIRQRIGEFLESGDSQSLKSALRPVVDIYGSDLITRVVHEIARERGKS